MTETKHKPVLIVIAGLNGSGKTTITSKYYVANGLRMLSTLIRIL